MSSMVLTGDIPRPISKLVAALKRGANLSREPECARWDSRLGTGHYLPQCLNHRLSRRPPRREESTDHTHDHREDQPRQQQSRRNPEAEGDLAEARPIGGAGDQPVDRQRQERADDSAGKLASTLLGGKPRVSSTAISWLREATAAYMVLIAPKMAPIAMMLVIITARMVRIRPSSCDCSA